MFASWLLFAGGLVPLISASAPSCTNFSLPQSLSTNTTLTSSQYYQANASVTTTDGNFTNLPAFCRLQLLIYTNLTAGSRSNTEVWLPEPDAWNNRTLAVGNGAFAGSIYFPELAYDALTLGYVGVATNTGHNDSTNINGSWAYQNENALIDFGYRAMHVSVVAMKEIAESYYNSSIEYSYYSGCSTGGRQGLSAITYYPEDFDGITIGSPANQWWALTSWSLYVANVVTPTNGSRWISADQWTYVVHPEILKQCDAQDGVLDGIIGNPLDCKIDWSPLACQGGVANSTCLTPDQIAAAIALYDDFVISDGTWNSTNIYPGFTFGSEDQFIPLNPTVPGAVGSAFPAAVTYYQYVVLNQTQTFDPTNLTFADIQIAKNTNTYFQGDNMNFTTFFNRGGKIIQYVGFADQLIAAKHSLRWYEEVSQFMATYTTMNISDHYILYTLPGMNHCQGGYGAYAIGGSGQAGAGYPATSFDPEHNIVAATQAWVENQQQPGNLIGAYYTGGNVTAGNGQVNFTRPVCQWPETVYYSGSGDVSNASSFYCATYARS